MSANLGVRAFSEALRLGRDRDLLPFTLIPALISLLVIGTGSWFGFGYIATLGARLTDNLPGWLGFLETILVPLLYLIGLLLGVWIFGLLAVVVASPFLGTLSNAVERKLWGADAVAATSWWDEIGSALGRELRKFGYHLPRLLAVFVLTLIPVVNLAAPFIWLLFGAWTMAVQFCDYPGENRRLPFRDTLDRLRRHRAAALGFGLCVALSLAIPLLNLVLVPVAVIGGTILWRQLEDADGA